MGNNLNTLQNTKSIVITWEFLEFSSDYVLYTTAQPSLANTMQDMFLGIIGGIMGYFITNS